MNTVLPFCSFDSAIALRWLEHQHNQNHDLFLMPVRGLDSTAHVGTAQGNWKSITLLIDSYGITGNWTSDLEVRNPAGPNSLFRQAAMHFCMNKCGPWFWCEPDCIPLAQDSFDRLEAEYLTYGKPYMGVRWDVPVPHLNGNMVCPEDAITVQSIALPMKTKDGSREVAFDLACAPQVLPRCHYTKLIQHVFRAPPFTSKDDRSPPFTARQDFEARVSKDAAFYHSDKSGSIYQFLKGGDATVGEGIAPLTTAAPTSEPEGAANNLDAQASAPEQSGDGVLPLVPSLKPAHPSELKQRRQAAMAHARAVRAENIRLGRTDGSGVAKWKRKLGKRAKMRRNAKVKS